MFSLPSDFVTQVASSSTQVIAAMAPFVELILGVLLATIVISILVHALRGGGSH